MRNKGNIPADGVTPEIEALGRAAGLYNGSCLDMFSDIPDGASTLIHADPPWPYENAAVGVQGSTGQAKYGGIPLSDIRDHLLAAYRLGAKNSYLAVWGTLPMLMAFASVHSLRVTKVGGHELWIGEPGDGWRVITGGVWAKVADLGSGYHFRSDAEYVILYAKGAPRARIHASNLWLERRRGHSHKSLLALRTLLEMGTSRGGRVIDVYAGDSGDLARMCRLYGRGYNGAEIDPVRFRRACLAVTQSDLPGIEMGDGQFFRRRKEKTVAPLLPGFELSEASK